MLRSLMCEFHTSAKRVIFKAAVTYLGFRDNRIKKYFVDKHDLVAYFAHLY